MIIASVVLPRPGGPGQQHVVGRRTAAARRLEHQRDLLADPLLPDELVEGARPQARVEGPLVDADEGRQQLVVRLGRHRRSSARSAALRIAARRSARRPRR
jgi:hypothetical protein